MGVALRTAVPADRPSLEIIRQQAIEAAYAHRYDRTTVADWVATPERDLSTWIADDRYVTFVATTDVTQVGYAIADRSNGRIEAIYVAPDYEGRGYGTALLAATEDRVRAAGVSALSVEAPAPVSGFFERYGFERAGDRSAHVVPRVRLEKSLDG